MANANPIPFPQSIKITLRRVRLDQGGYDASGAYWGVGAPLYWACDDAGYDEYFRARGREAAKQRVRERFPGARFYPNSFA